MWKLSPKHSVTKASAFVLAFTSQALSHAAPEDAPVTPPTSVATTPDPTSTVVIRASKVLASPPPSAPTLIASPTAIGASFTQIDMQALQESRATPTRMDDLLVDYGLGSHDASASLGIATGLNVRGFALVSATQVARTFINGHSDIVWRFSRDPSTVQAVQLLAGADAALLGSSNPGAALMLVTKQPTGREQRVLDVALGTNHLWRTSADIEKHWSDALQTRAVVTVQGGAIGIEQVVDARQAVLLSNVLKAGRTQFKLDLESLRDTRPFAFGTAYVQNRFWLDNAYVDADRASAKRLHKRYALYADHALDESEAARLTLHAYTQRVSSHRDETLIGFYAPVGNALSGYYRTIDEQIAQTDKGVRLVRTHKSSIGATGGNFAFAPVLTGLDWQIAIQRSSLQREFLGPQNIGGFMLDPQNPIYPANLTALKLSTRYAREQYAERGLAASTTAHFGGAQLRAALRHSGFGLDGTSTLGVSNLPTQAQAKHQTWSLGALYPLSAHYSVWRTRASSFMVNRGMFATGEFLPPSRGVQHETGVQYRRISDVGQLQLSAAFFDITQDNLPARDPSNSDAYVLLGVNRSQGWELKASAEEGKWRGQLSLTRMSARVVQKTTASQGDYLTGMPSGYAAAQLGYAWQKGSQAWGGLQAVSARPGDSLATFDAAGYVVGNVGISHTLQQNPLLRFDVSIRNLTDARYVRALSGADNVWAGEPRTLQLGMRLGF